MHKVGVVHRDVKHLNVFIKTLFEGKDTTSLNRQQPTVKLGDLGMAAKLSKNQMIEKVAGTVAFMAPEVLLGEPSNFKVDVWSLGVILHHLACKKLPFSG